MIDKNRSTPAHPNYDGVDFVPAKLPVLFGHHFALIAGTGPIVAAAFGWLPAALWIIFGSVFIDIQYTITTELTPSISFYRQNDASLV